MDIIKQLLENVSTPSERMGWVDRGRAKGAKWLISVCDTFDYSDYPVFCMTDEEKDEKVECYSMASPHTITQRINEIIKLD
jgi:hypothetical protein